MSVEAKGVAGDLLYDLHEVEQAFEETDAYAFLNDINDVNQLTIESSDGVEIHGELRNIILRKLMYSDYEGILELVLSYDLVLGVERVQNPLARTIAQTRSVERLASHRRTTNGHTIDAVSTMRGTVTFNANGTLSQNVNPSVTIQTFIGSGWSVTRSNIRGSFSSVNNNRGIQWTGSFSLSATFIHQHLPFMSVNFGSFTASHRIGS